MKVCIHDPVPVARHRSVWQGSLIGVVALLTACASAPPTRTCTCRFDEHDFAAFNADAARVRLIVPGEFALDVSRSALTVGVDGKTGEHRDASFLLEQEQKDVQSTPGGLFLAPEQRNTYTLRMTEASRAAFRELQVFAAQTHADKVTIDVQPKIAHKARDTDAVTVSIELLLDEAQGYFMLENKARIALSSPPTTKAARY